jgi:uncharacterized protein (DUF885 family)
VRRFLPLFCLAASCSLYTPDPGPVGRIPDSWESEPMAFSSLAEAYLAWHYAARPSLATSAGIHDHDDRLERCSREDLDAQGVALRTYLRRLSRIDLPVLGEGDRCDMAILEGHMRARLLDLETIRPWQRDPGVYRRIVSDGLHALAALSFNTPGHRMAMATGRLGEVPRLLEEAARNLENPPRVLTETAIEEFAGTRAFIAAALPRAFETVRDETLRSRFEEARKPALEAVERFIDWMRRDLLPRSAGDVAIGPEALKAKLLHQERIDVPLEDLVARGYDYLRNTREEMKNLAGDRPVKGVLREAAKDRIPADRLLDETRSTLGGVRAWAATVVTLPPDAECAVRETPEFRRSGSFASMESPGPFETVAREAFYSITLPDPSWTPERRDQHLSFFNSHSLPLISAHETYPGHLVQSLAARQCPSRVRRAFRSGSFTEGWALYCERLYAERPEATPGIRFHQAHLALLRICRYLAALEIHTRKMTLDQAVEFFVNEGYQERANAEREARRAAADPMVLVYTWGKVEILNLRDEYLAAGAGSLRDFHDGLLKLGAPPLPLARQLLRTN